MGDVIELVHPKGQDEHQRMLFEYLLDVRHGVRDEDKRMRALSELPGIMHFKAWVDGGAPLLDTLPKLVTWETLSTYHKMDAKAWEHVIPNMGYMALLRNLRNFSEAGIDTSHESYVFDKIRDPEEVAKSRQFPIRFYTAYKAFESVTWGAALEMALQASVRNVPSFAGRTLILVDCSGSMQPSWGGQRGSTSRMELATLFGSALALRAERADLIAYGSGSKRVGFRKSDSVLRLMQKFGDMGGTETWQSVERHYTDQDRIVILTDEQAFAKTQRVWGRYDDVDPSSWDNYPCPIYTFNLAGYEAGHAPSGEKGRYTFGGLTDAGFRMIAALDDMRSQGWPWEGE
jgi:hypothetical protein